MPALSLHLGDISCFQSATGTRLLSRASVEISTEGSFENGSALALSSFLELDVWTTARSCFTISLNVSFDDDSSFLFGSRRALLSQLGKTLSEAELWSQLKLRVDVCSPPNGLEVNLEKSKTLKLEARPRYATNSHEPWCDCQAPEYSGDSVDVRPPCGVRNYLLQAVTISLSFSCLLPTAVVPRKRRSSEIDVLSDILDEPLLSIGGMPRTVSFDEQFMDIASSQRLFAECPMQRLDDCNLLDAPASTYTSSEQTFAALCSSGSRDQSGDTESLVFSSQGSTPLQSQDTNVEKASDLLSSLQMLAMNALIDGALRNLICPKPIRMASGIRTETSDLEARLIDIAPSTFSPGYSEAVASRTPLLPTVARFLTLFLEKAKSTSVTRTRDTLPESLPNLQSVQLPQVQEHSQDEETPRRLKDVLRVHLWMTMTNHLRNPDLARRLKPLQQLAKSKKGQSTDLLDSEDTGQEFGKLDGISHDETFQEDHDARFRTICYETDDNEEMLGFDEDEEASNYEPDLFEEYEQRLRSHFDHENADDIDPGHQGSEHCVHLQAASDNSAFCLSSPMLELQGQLPRLNAPDEMMSSPFEQILEGSSAATLADTWITCGIGKDDESRSLLDEGAPHDFKAATENEATTRPSPLIPDDWEPDFEQWDFDVDDGSDDMLF